jgi:hypothetical protein
MAEIRVGTSAFTAGGWEGTFYSKGLPARGQLSYYATQFDTVGMTGCFVVVPSTGGADQCCHPFDFAQGRLSATVGMTGKGKGRHGPPIPSARLRASGMTECEAGVLWLFY